MEGAAIAYTYLFPVRHKTPLKGLKGFQGKVFPFDMRNTIIIIIKTLETGEHPGDDPHQGRCTKKIKSNNG